MLKSELLSEQVYQTLRSEVISGEWDIGQRVNEQDLANRLHVSRTPVRSALQRIAQEGLLTHSKHWGYQVRVATAKDVEEIYKIRTALEILATCEASKKLTEEDKAVFHDILTASRRACDANNARELMNYSTQFNCYIYQIADMPRLMVIQNNLQDYLLRFRNLSFGGEGSARRQLSVEEHEQIFEAMCDADEERICHLIETHLSHSKAYILEVIQSTSSADSEQA